VSELSELFDRSLNWWFPHFFSR